MRPTRAQHSAGQQFSRGASRLGLIVAVACRNLWLDRLRTTVIGTLLAFGAFLAVVGLSLLRDVQTSMRASITESIAGDLQLYSATAKDDLALFGSTFMGRADVGILPDFASYRDLVLRNSNVAAFVPMGLDMAILGRGNELDDSIDGLRVALKSQEPATIQSRIDQLRFQMEQLRAELVARRQLVADKGEIDAQDRDLVAAMAPGYLAAGTIDEAKLQFLETKIAPISGEKQPIYLQYLGTDIGLYRANFPKYQVVEGRSLGPGERGIMISKKVREEQLKNSVARLFDKIHKHIEKSRGRIAGDAESERQARELQNQYPQILAYLDRAQAAALSTKLTGIGIAADGQGALVPQLGRQLTRFLTVDDSNFAARYAWFYANIAPHIRLYEISPGQTISLRSYTKSGYIKTVPVKVYGVYSFAGLEDSDLAGVMNIVDLVSFRELYGQMTEDSRRELQQMRQQVGLREVSAADAEAALFGASAPNGTATAAAPAATTSEPLQVKPVLADHFAPDEILSGLALNAAIVLKDPHREDATMRELNHDLEPMHGKVIGWQQATGIVGQFVNIVGLTLVFALGVIFLVAFVIINNSIIVGTLNRTREIGTMRAIGAPRSFVVLLFLAETGITGLIGAVLGTVLAVLALVVAGRLGIPAGTDVVSFLFSGPRLYPKLHWGLVWASPVVITAVATLASIYAARHAAHIQPAEATQEKE